MKKSLPFIIGGLIIVGAAVWFFTSQPSNSSTSSSTSTGSNTSESSNASTSSSTTNSTSSSSTAISTSDLAKNNGKSGSKCWVAVNGTVYDVSGEREWKNGQHTSSDGQAYCGADMSDVIGDSPHGTRVLGSLPVVGKLQ